jgi:hypothetical protein
MSVFDPNGAISFHLSRKQTGVNACQKRQIVDLVLIWTDIRRSRRSLGIRWSKFLLRGAEATASRLALSIFQEIMSGAAGFLTRHIRKGAVASFYVSIKFHLQTESRTWTCAYRTASSCLKYPSITSGPSIDVGHSLPLMLRTVLHGALVVVDQEGQRSREDQEEQS